MNTGWTLYIAILTIANILACVWLLWWTARKRPDERGEHETTGHVWDDNLQELNRPMPRWWLNLFYLTIVFSLGYLVLYPGLGAFAGTKSWTSGKEHDTEVAAAEAQLAPLFARFAQQSPGELAKNPEAVQLGRSVFAHNCVQCHGSDARGATGFPNLTDKDWLWGGDPDTVLATILNGRQGAMPAWGQMLGEQGVTEVASYVQTLSGAKVDDALARAGEARYKQICVACHGPEGKGNPALGAPNLTDDVWLYGGSFEQIATTVRNGRNGRMPAHQPIIGADRARVAAAYVLSLQDGGAKR